MKHLRSECRAQQSGPRVNQQSVLWPTQIFKITEIKGSCLLNSEWVRQNASFGGTIVLLHCLLSWNQRRISVTTAGKFTLILAHSLSIRFVTRIPSSRFVLNQVRVADHFHKANDEARLTWSLETFNISWRPALESTLAKQWAVTVTMLPRFVVSSSYVKVKYMWTIK